MACLTQPHRRQFHSWSGNVGMSLACTLNTSATGSIHSEYTIFFSQFSSRQDFVRNRTFRDNAMCEFILILSRVRRVLRLLVGMALAKTVGERMRTRANREPTSRRKTMVSPEIAATPADPRIELARRCITEAELEMIRVQIRLRNLKSNGLATADAEGMLSQCNMKLVQLRNHYDIVTNLLSPPLQRSKRSDY
jgi:hypothetical protein